MKLEEQGLLTYEEFGKVKQRILGSSWAAEPYDADRCMNSRGQG